MINGKLQPCSLDVYIAMEYGSDGDLFNLRSLPLASSDKQPALWTLKEQPPGHVRCHTQALGAYICSYTYLIKLLRRTPWCLIQGPDER